MSEFDEQAARDFLRGKSEDSFDESAARDFLKSTPEKTEEAPRPKHTGAVESLIQWGAGFNDNLLNTLDLPNHAFNWAAEKLGVDYRVPSTRDLGEKLRIGYSREEEPDTGSYRSGKFTSMGLEFLTPVLLATNPAKLAAIPGAKRIAGTLAKSSSNSPGVAMGVAETIAKPFKVAPVTSFSGEIAGGVSSGYGSYYGEQKYGAIGEQVGGLGLGIAGSVIGSMPLSYRLMNKLSEKIFPYTKPGARQRAHKILIQSSEGEDIVPTIQRNRAKVLSSSKITPARLTGDPDLMALERVLVDEDPELARQLRELDLRNNVVARRALLGMQGDESVQEAQRALTGRYTRLATRLNAIMDSKISKAQEAIQNLNPKVKRDTANTMIRKGIDDALDAARTDENTLWRAVPVDEVADTKPIRESLKNILLTRYSADDPSEIPAYIRRYVGDLKDGEFVSGVYKDAESAGELHALRKRILKDMRAEKKKEATDWNKVRIMDEIQDSVLDALDNSGASEQIREAIDFSRNLNQRFRGGILNVILGNDANGGMLAPTLTMESVGPGARGAEDIRRILQASPESKESVEQVLKAEMLYKLVNQQKGRLNINAAKKYAINNDETLKLFPQMRDDLDKAIALEEQATWYKGVAKNRLNKAQQSTSYKVSTASPKRVLTTILESENPQQEIVKQASRLNDKGKVGLKNDIIDSIYGHARTGDVGDDGSRIISGDKMYSYWTDNKSTFGKIMDAGTVNRLEKIINTLRLSQGSKDLPVERAKSQLKPTSGLIEVAVRILAAKGAAKSGVAGGSAGAGLQTAQIASSRAKRLLGELDTGRTKQLLKDAIFDEELYSALATDTTKLTPESKPWRVIQGWMVANAVETMQETQE